MNMSELKPSLPVRLTDFRVGPFSVSVVVSCYLQESGQHLPLCPISQPIGHERFDPTNVALSVLPIPSFTMQLVESFKYVADDLQTPEARPGMSVAIPPATQVALIANAWHRHNGLRR